MIAVIAVIAVVTAAIVAVTIAGVAVAVAAIFARWACVLRGCGEAAFEVTTAIAELVNSC